MGNVGQDLKAHLVPGHIPESPFQVPGLPRERVLRDVVHLKNRGPIIKAPKFYLQCRRLLSHQADHLFRKNVGMDVYGFFLQMHQSLASFIK